MNTDEVGHGAQIVPYWRQSNAVPEGRAVFAVVLQFDGGGFALCDGPTHSIDGFGIRIGPLQKTHVPAKHLFGAVTGQMLETLVDENGWMARLVGVGDTDSLSGRINSPVPQQQFPFGLLSLGDIHG